MKKKYISILLTAAVVSVSLFTGCKKEEAPEVKEVEKLGVTVTAPVQGNISVVNDYAGSLEYADEISVFPKLSGEVTCANFEEGDHVNAGDLLFTLDDESYQMSLKTAKATYDTTEASVNQQLGAMKMNRDNAENSLMTAEEGIGQAQNTYGYYQTQYSDLEEKIDDLEEDKSDLKDDKKSAKRKYKKAKAALKDAKEAAQEANRIYKEAQNDGTSEDELTKLKTAASQADAAVSAAQTNVNTLKSTLSSIESGIDQIENSIDQVESSEDTLSYQMRNLNYTYEQAMRGTALAREGLDYYDNYTAPATIETADASRRQAQVGVESAELQLRYTKISAPVSGTIKEKKIDKYDMVQAGSPAYVITNDDSVVVTFNVPESAFKSLEIGQEVTVERDGKEYKGSVSELPQTPDASTGLFKIKAIVDDPAKELSVGVAVKLSTIVSRADNVLTVPVDCIYYSAGQAYAYAVDNGVIRKAYVTTGLYDENNIEILDGLSAADRVVTVWSSDLRDGLEVNVVNDESGGAARYDAGADSGDTSYDGGALPAAGAGVIENELIEGGGDGTVDVKEENVHLAGM